MELKDVLHLYLGCEVEYLTNIGKLFGVHEAYAVMEITGVGMTRIETREYRNLKPILRPLSDMTEEEAIELYTQSRYAKGKWLIKSATITQQPPYQPFYMPYGMSEEEYTHECRIAADKMQEWEEANSLNNRFTSLLTSLGATNQRNLLLTEKI